MLKNPTGMNRDTLEAKFTTTSCQVSHASLPDVSAGYYQRALVDESGMTGTQTGMHNRSETFSKVVGPLPCDGERA
jgi:hypothetical protein